MQPETEEFVIIAPPSMGENVIYAKERILERLARSFPQYRFHITATGPASDDPEDTFRVIPVMGRVGEKVGDDPDRVRMCRPPDLWVVPAIKEVLREFELAPMLN